MGQTERVIPGTLAFVSFGASIESDFAGERIGVDLWIFAFSLALFTASFILWHLFKRKWSGAET